MNLFNRIIRIDDSDYQIRPARIKTGLALLRLHRPDAQADEWTLNAKLPGGKRVRVPLDKPVNWKREVERYETVRLQAQQG